MRELRLPRIGIREAVLLLAGLAVFGAGAHRHAEVVNTDRQRTDQSAYMAYAKGVAAEPLGYVGDRNRMPVYPYLLATVYDEDLEDEAFFERGKLFNIVLSGVLLVGLYLLFRTGMPPLPSLVLWSILTFTVFMFRAAYVQAELLFYALFFVAFLLMVRMLGRSSWLLAAATGGVLGVAHLTKASVLPALVLFIGFSALTIGHRLQRRLVDDRPVGRWLLRRLGHVAIVPVTFLVVTSPYLLNSKQAFGHYFYNVNSTFYMWYDSWDEVVQGTRAYGDREGWPRMDPDEIPGPKKYLEEHSGYEILDRFRDGLVHLYHSTRNSYGYFPYLVLYLGVAGGIAVVRPRATAELLDESLFVPLFVAAFAAVYLLLYAWYVPIASGNRLVLSLFLPLMWSLFAMVQAPGYRSPVARIRGREVSWRTGIHLLVGLLLVVHLASGLWPRVLRVYAGD